MTTASYEPQEFAIRVKLTKRAQREVQEQEIPHRSHRRRQVECFWCIADAFGAEIR